MHFMFFYLEDKFSKTVKRTQIMCSIYKQYVLIMDVLPVNAKLYKGYIQQLSAKQNK